MTEIEDISPEKRSGCGLFGAVFGRGNFWLRRSTSTGSLPGLNNKNNSNSLSRVPTTPNSKRRRGGSDDPTFLNETASKTSAPATPDRSGDRIIARPSPNHSRVPRAMVQSSAPSSIRSSPIQNYNGGQNPNRRVPKEAIGISGELESIINDHQKSKGTGGLVRASSSNVMLFGNLGNLRPPGGVIDNHNNNNIPKASKPEPKSTMGNRKNASNEEPPASLCRALSTRMDPETLKIMGNEDYKNGKFAEALALYDAAISLDPNKASYRSNKSAALTALGKLLDAVFECREAIRIDPHYQRAHHRLANLYLRLGDTDKATYHFKHAGPEADPEEKGKAQTLQALLSKCTEAKKLRDWSSLLRETGRAISAGADSAPQIFALQAETYLKLRRHEDADTTLSNGPQFEVDACTKFFGPIGNANLLMIRAQVDMVSGRFDEALAAAERAARLDSNSKEVSLVARRARAVAQARSDGNELFKASRFSDACAAYDEGLDHDSYNSVLLCNRAACRSKLGLFEKAVEDCTAALNVRPSYSKARLRRADCNSKLEKWEASVQDYEILLKQTPDNEEVGRALLEVQVKLKKKRGEDVKDMKYDNASEIDMTKR